MGWQFDQVKWRVLLVDDDEDDYMLTRQMLSEAKLGKIELDWASTFESGLEAIRNRNNGYDAVLMDYDLGAKTGIELIREAVSWGYTAPFILLTGRGSYEVDVEAMQAGATLYLTKVEANPLLLERGIRYAIELKQKEEDLRKANEELKKLNENLKRELELRRKTEKELANSEERYRAVCENLLDVSYRRNLQTETYEYISPVVEQVLGFSPEEMSMMSDHDLFEHVHPEDLPSVQYRLEEGNRSGKGKLEYRFRTKNGQYIWLADFFTVQMDDSGAPLYRGGMVRDITERKYAEIERDSVLLESEEQRRLLETIVENLPAGMAVLEGPELRYQLINPAYEAIARKKGPVLGRTLAQVWPEFVDHEIQRRFHQVYATGISAHLLDIRVNVDRGEGTEEVYFNVDILPMKDSSGITTGLLVFTIETTGQVLARKRLEEIISRGKLNL